MDDWSSSYDHFLFCAYKCPFLLYSRIGSVLELLVLKNAVDCTSQRLKRTSGARVMTIFSCLTYNWSFLMYLTIGSVLELLVLKNAAQRTSQSLKRPSGARVMTCSQSRTLR